MSRIILCVFAVGLLFAAAQALQCYKCGLGIWNLCITTTTTCNSGQSCYTGIGTAAQVISIKMKGCLNVGDCNTVISQNFSGNNVIYSMNRTCCNTDLCNTAPRQARVTPLFLTLAVLGGGAATALLV